MSQKMSYSKILAWAVSLGLPLLIYMIPTTQSFTGQMRTFLIITVFAILTIAFETLPQSAVTFLLPVSYVFFGLANSATAWLPWTMTTVWMIIGALLLVNVLDSSGLLTRIAYRLILMVGGSYRGLVLGMGALGVVLNILLFGSGYIILAGLAFGLCQALELPKFSKEGTGIFLAAAIGGVIPPIFVYGSNLLMQEGIGASVVGEMHISYLGYTYFCLPVILYFILALFLILLMFRPTTQISGKAYFQEKLQEMGAMTLTEKKGLVWIVLLFAYIIAAGFLGWDSTWAFIIFPALMICPAIGCGSAEDVNRLNFSFILFIASCMSIGFVAGSLGFGQLIAELSLPLTSSVGPTVVVYVIYLINILLNFLLTPMAISTGFTPTFLQITTPLGINPYVIYSTVTLGCDQILFPYEYALYMMYFSFGYIAMKDFIKYFGAKMLLCMIFFPLIIIPFWMITGQFYM